jgi:hypothetical protein
VSAESIAEAKARIDRAGLANVELRQADLFSLPYEAGAFDHVFVCFVLEHLSRPVEALSTLTSRLDHRHRRRSRLDALSSRHCGRERSDPVSGDAATPGTRSSLRPTLR